MASDRRPGGYRALLDGLIGRIPWACREKGDKRLRGNTSLFRNFVYDVTEIDAETAKQEGRDPLPGMHQQERAEPEAPQTSEKVKLVRSIKLGNKSWHDHLVMLLQIAAGIEHALMVQYLYAAYSIGGARIPADERDTVNRWRDSILAVAKEEMGHLLTVQNILTFTGGSTSLDRSDFPWDVKYYPFPFLLEPLTLQSLSCYVYAEMPTRKEIENDEAQDPRYRDFLNRDLETIKKAVEKRDKTPHRVGMLYSEIIAVLEDPNLVPDSWLRPETVEWQAAREEWGRGYAGGLRGDMKREAEHNHNTHRAGAVRADASYFEPNVVIASVSTRAQALAALDQISAQGEGPRGPNPEEPSHFDRFLEIYQEHEKVGDSGWCLSRKLATNPTTFKDKEAGNVGAYIKLDYSRHWAYLFNLRYRMLLTYLAHSLRLPRVTANDRPNVRAMVMQRIFGEMYNLKAISRLIVRLPMNADRNSDYAGPPFEMPYTTRLPPDEVDCWDVYLDMLITSAKLARCLIKGAKEQDPNALAYLTSLCDVDRQTYDWAKQVRSDVYAYQRPFA